MRNYKTIMSGALPEDSHFIASIVDKCIAEACASLESESVIAVNTVPIVIQGYPFLAVTVIVEPVTRLEMNHAVTAVETPMSDVVFSQRGGRREMALRKGD